MAPRFSFVQPTVGWSAMIRYPNIPDELKKHISLRGWEILDAWWGEVQNMMRLQNSKTIKGAASDAPYILSSVSVNRTFDTTSATDLYLSTRVGTLLNDLRNKGILG